MVKIEDGARQHIAKFLPSALEKALSSYQIFQDRDCHENPKDFKAHHDASKTAISHIELLLKLVEQLKLFEGGGDDAQYAALANMINNARTEVGLYKEVEK